LAFALLDWSTAVAELDFALGVVVALGTFVGGTAVVDTVTGEAVVADTGESGGIEGAVWLACGLGVAVIIVAWTKGLACVAITGETF
jgi:hypothetical protein